MVEDVEEIRHFSKMTLCTVYTSGAHCGRMEHAFMMQGVEKESLRATIQKSLGQHLKAHKHIFCL